MTCSSFLVRFVFFRRFESHFFLIFVSVMQSWWLSHAFNHFIQTPGLFGIIAWRMLIVLVCVLWCSQVVSLIYTNAIYIFPFKCSHTEMFIFLFYWIWKRRKGKAIRETTHIQSLRETHGQGRPRWKTQYFCPVWEVYTLPGGFCTKKRHIDKFHNKMSFSKNSRFNFFLYSCYMISVVYDS